MATRLKLSPVQILERFRREKRMEALQRVKLAGYEFVISQLEVELNYLRRGDTVPGGVRPVSYRLIAWQNSALAHLHHQCLRPKSRFPYWKI
jgi:hypothetical protein